MKALEESSIILKTVKMCWDQTIGETLLSHLPFSPALRTLSLTGIFLPSPLILLHSEGQNLPSTSNSVGMPSPSLNILIIPPRSVAGSQKTPSYAPNDLPGFACTSFCVFLYFEVQRSLEKSFFWFQRQRRGDRPWVSPSPEWVYLGTQWQSDCSQDQKQPSPLCPHVQDRWPWSDETPVSRPRISAQICQSLKRQGPGLLLSFLEDLESKSVQSTEIFFWIPTMC